MLLLIQLPCKSIVEEGPRKPLTRTMFHPEDNTADLKACGVQSVHEGTSSCSAQADTADELACGNRAERGKVLASLSELPRVPVCTSWPPQSWQRFPSGPATSDLPAPESSTRIDRTALSRSRRLSGVNTGHRRTVHRRLRSVVGACSPRPCGHGKFRAPQPKRSGRVVHCVVRFRTPLPYLVGHRHRPAT